MFTSKNLVRLVLVILSISLCLLIAGSAFAMATEESRGAILYVNSYNNSDCTSWDEACFLQTALDRAVPGDQIWVAAGFHQPTYSFDRSASFHLKSGVAIYGGFPSQGGDWSERNWKTNFTYLTGDIGYEGFDGDNSFHVLTAINVDNTAILDGFIVQLGNANLSDNSYGGGMFISSGSPRLNNIMFFVNYAVNGAGIYAENNSNPILTNIYFHGNQANDYGGGIYNYMNSSPIIKDSIFESNYGGAGGGMMNYDYSSPVLSNVLFINNSTDTEGGGMYNAVYSSPQLTNVSFIDNSANKDGGGISSDYYCNPSLTNAQFSENTAGNSGGGIYNINYSNLTLRNVTFVGNTAEGGTGGGIQIMNESSLNVTNATFSENSAFYYGGAIDSAINSITNITNATVINNSAQHNGGGIAISGQVYAIIINSILWGNSPDQLVGPNNVTYSNVQEGYSGEGNINLDPLLGPLQDNGGFTFTHALLPGSPAIDAGSPDNCPSHDQCGYPRPIDGNEDGIARCDMGAYEYGEFLLPHIFLPLIQR